MQAALRSSRAFRLPVRNWSFARSGRGRRKFRVTLWAGLRIRVVWQLGWSSKRGFGSTPAGRGARRISHKTS